MPPLTQLQSGCDAELVEGWFNTNTGIVKDSGAWIPNGAQANVFSFDSKAGSKNRWTEGTWFYSYRTNIHHTLKRIHLKLGSWESPSIAITPRTSKSDEKPGVQKGFDKLSLTSKLRLTVRWVKTAVSESSLSEEIIAPDITSLEITRQEINQ